MSSSRLNNTHSPLSPAFGAQQADWGKKMQIDYLACAACLTKSDSLIGLDFMNPGEGQALCLVFQLRVGLSNHGLMVGGRDNNQHASTSELCSGDFVAG